MSQSKNHKNKSRTDVLVIGGGPAGMMAAGRAAERGLRVILLEKNSTLGKKLLITGGGRCNLTNAEFDVRKFLGHLGKSGQFLFSAFAGFSSKDTIDFFNAQKVATKIEENKRVFPASDSAATIQRALISYMKKGGVEVLTDVAVSGFLTKDKKITGVRIRRNGKAAVIEAEHFILACGGTSHPETGSTGDGYKWLKEIGHTISTPALSLVPIAIKDSWVKNLQGITLPSIKISVIQKKENKLSKNGRLLFTHFGVSGPMIINLSQAVGELLEYGPVIFSLDLFPKLDPGLLDKKIQALFETNKNKILKNCLPELFPPALSATILSLSGISGEIPVHSIKKDARLKLIKTIKDLRMTVAHLLGPEKSIVTSGGVSLKEVDFKTMRSRLYPNLSFAGDILDINRPSGGFSLQICWTTGYVAGSNAKS